MIEFKLSKKERAIVAVAKRYAGEEMSMDDLMHGFGKPLSAKAPRQSMMVTMRRLCERLARVGVPMVRVSPVGRGYKGRWFVPLQILEIP